MKVQLRLLYLSNGMVYFTGDFRPRKPSSVRYWAANLGGLARQFLARSSNMLSQDFAQFLGLSLRNRFYGVQGSKQSCVRSLTHARQRTKWFVEFVEWLLPRRTRRSVFDPNKPRNGRPMHDIITCCPCANVANNPSHKAGVCKSVLGWSLRILSRCSWTSPTKPPPHAIVS